MRRRLPAPLPWLGALLAIYLCAPFVAAIQQAGLADWQSVNATALWRALAVSLSSATLSVALILIQREIESTMVIVTHDPDEAALLGDEILVLDQGRVLQTGTTEAVFTRPASETVAHRSSDPITGPCRLSIDPRSIQVWKA